MISFLISEFIKTKRSSSLVLIISFPIILIGIFFFSFFFQSKSEYYLKLSPGEDGNPWFNYYKNFIYVFAITLPIISSIITFIVKNIEDKANGWKSLLSLPLPFSIIYLIKFSVIIGYLFAYHLLSIALLLGSAKILSVIKPDFDFALFPSYIDFVFIIFVKLLLASFAIGSLTYCFLIYFKRTTTGLLLSIFLPLFGVFVEYWYNVYSIPFMDVSDPIRARSMYIRTYGNGNALGFDFSFSFYAQWIVLIWIIFSWVLIYFQAKRANINYH